MNPTTGVQLLIAIGCSEGTGEEGGAEIFPSTSRNGESVKSMLYKKGCDTGSVGHQCKGANW